MAKLARLLIGLIVMTACAGPTRSADTTTTAPTALVQTSTTTSVPAIGAIRGALPDGTIYDIAFPTPRAEAIDQIEAELIVEVDDREVLLGVEFRQGRASDSTAELVFPAGGWTVEIDIQDSVGTRTREVIGRAIEVSTEVEMPVFTLQPPLRWSRPPQVTYDTFIVRTGCPDEAAACNPTHAVSVTLRTGEELDSPISVQTYALRPRSDPYYLPPGPLSARWSPDVIWTGEEMIVWGGSADPGPPTLIDGAGFDPETDKWRKLSASPLTGEQQSRAVWASQEMIILGEEATVAWDSRGDSWRVIGGGIVPPLDPGMTVATGSQIITWTTEGLYRLGGEGDWEVLPDPDVGDPHLQGSVLRVVGPTLFAVGHDECDRLVTRWEQNSWSELTRISLGASGPGCGHPKQTAVVDDKLVMWDDTTGNVVSYHPASGTIYQLKPLPLPAIEQAPGPLHLDDGFLVTAGLDAAIFESPGQWRTVELPGLGTDVDMVWTGHEVLMWGKCCYGPDDIDAWEWVLP